MGSFPGGTISGNIIPANNGEDLGTPNFRWDAFLQQLDVQGITHSIVGDVTIDGSLTLTPGSVLTADITGNVTGNVVGNVVGDITSAGTSTFNIENAKVRNGIRFADQFTGATVDAKINAAIADLPAVGGTVDARALSGAQIIADQINVGGSGKRVMLRLPDTGDWSVTINDATKSAFVLYDACSVISEGVSDNGMIIDCAAGASIASIMTFDPEGVAWMEAAVRGLMLRNTHNATVANAILDVHHLEFSSQIEDISIQAFNGIGLWVHTKMSVCSFRDVYCNGAEIAGSRPIVIQGDAVSFSQLTFFNCSAENPAAGNFNLEINGSGEDATQGIAFFGFHLEKGFSDATDTAYVRIVDAKSISFNNVFVVPNHAPITNSFSFEIAETVAGYTKGISLTCIDSGNGGKAVDDKIHSTQVIKKYLNLYTLGNTNGVTPDDDWAQINGTTFDPSQGVTIGGGSPVSKIVAYTPTLSPSAVNAQTAAEQTFTVTGISVLDHLVLSPPAPGNATAASSIRPTTTNQIAINFVNASTTTLTPAIGIYRILAIRS